MNYEHDFVTFFTGWESEKMTSLWISDRIYRADGDYSDLSELTWMEACEDSAFGGKLVENQHCNLYERDIPTTSSGVGWWSDKLYYFPPDSPDSVAGNEIVSEFYVSYDNLPHAIKDLYAIKDKFAHLVTFSEFRPIE